MDTTQRLAHQRCQAVFDALGYGVLLLTPDGRIEQVNRAMAAILGQRPENLIGHTPQKVVPGLPPPSEGCPFQRLRKTLRQESAEWQWGERWFQVTADPILDYKGKLTGAVLTFAETTQQKLLEEQLRRSQKLEAVGRLAGALAHDFSNLLTIIDGYGQMLLEGMPARGSRRKDLEAILEATDRATALTRQLLTIGRRQPARLRRLDLNRLLARLERVLRRVLGRHIKFSLRLGRPLGRIRADPAQLEQILMNLVINAREAMPKGGHLTLSTSQTRILNTDGARPDLRPGRYVVLTVQDTGAGMDPKTKSHLFEPFLSTKGRGKGVGLGLSIVYGLVRQSHGEIEVDSELGRGTTFRIYYPVAPARRTS